MSSLQYCLPRHVQICCGDFKHHLKTLRYLKRMKRHLCKVQTVQFVKNGSGTVHADQCSQAVLHPCKLTEDECQFLDIQKPFSTLKIFLINPILSDTQRHLRLEHTVQSISSLSLTHVKVMHTAKPLAET